jgi:hypothetical protein
MDEWMDGWLVGGMKVGRKWDEGGMDGYKQRRRKRTRGQDTVDVPNKTGSD